MAEPADFLKPHIQALHQRGRLRVWSLVVTIMGDVVVPRRKLIAMADLLEITGHMGIEAGAMRTAMSRLSKEGWVSGTRSGRVSHYGFGKTGLADYAPAAQKIYAGPRSTDSDRWRLLYYESESETNRHTGFGGFEIAPGMILHPYTAREQVKTDEGCGSFVISGRIEAIPNWLKKRITSEEAVSAFNDLSARLNAMIETLSDPEPLDAMVARILVIHEWRRLVLRYPVPPLEFQPDNQPAEQARRRVQTVYEKLVPPSQKYWKSPVSEEEQAILASRFKQI